jgi:superfamily I DNA/RNA helicase/RecB family exonuclease
MKKSKQAITAKFRKNSLAERGLSLELPAEQLGPEQLEVAALPMGSVALAVGSPGAGKTTALKALFLSLARADKPESIVTVAANRFAANKLRDELALAYQGATLGPLSRTLSSLAFSILRFNAIERGNKLPELISGSEQDAMLEEILERVADGELKYPEFPKHINKNVLGLAGFRNELRDLLAVAIERSISPSQLAKMGLEQNKPEWVGASAIYDYYLRELSLDVHSHRFDPSSLLVEATKLLRAGVWPSQLLAAKQFLVDDAQELTPAAADFILALTENPNGTRAGVVLFGDPDAATMGFRAGDPEAMSRLVETIATALSRTSTVITIQPRPNSHPANIANAMKRITPRIAVAGAGQQRKGVGAGLDNEADAADKSVKARVFTLQQEESAWIANQLRKLHLNKGVRFGDMAVVARSVDELEELEFALAAESVPVRILGAKSALRDEFGSAAYLRLLQVVLNRPTIDFKLAVELLSSPIGRFDALSLRRLRRKLRSIELQQGGERNSQILIADLFSSRATAATIETAEGKQVHKFLQLFFDLIDLSEKSDSTVEDLLWLAWSSSNPSRSWPTASLGVEEVALQVGRNLDSVVALFSSAARYVERNPNGNAAEFIEQQLNLRLPEDTLGTNANAANSVALLTPAALIGRQFKVLALAHMQEGIWPNLKPRSSLLGANVFDALARDSNYDIKTQQRSELPSELRMLYKAVGAATEKLLVSAIDTEEEQVSQFVRLLAGKTVEAREYTKTRYTLRGLVGRLRSDLIEAESESERLSIAAHLARLANAGVPGAHPESWYGLIAPSTDEPLAVLDAPDGDPNQLVLHPSELENFIKCPLHWFINAHGGGDTSFKTRVGTLMHEVLETATVNDEAHFWKIVDSKWSNIEFDSDWQEAAEHRRVGKMISKLLSYLQSFDAAGGKVIAREVGFKFDIAGAKVRGKVDRIEIYPDGTVIIADLKTSKYKVAADKVTNNAQLGIYQLAALAEKFDGIPELAENPNLAGARLIEVGTKEKQIVAEQPSLKNDPLLRLDIESTIEAITEGMLMKEQVFVAKVGEHCTDPYGFGSCSLHLIDQVTYGN